MDEKEIYELGDKPQLGVVPKKMHAFLVRQNRFGNPKDAWQREIINVPSLGPKDVLVYVMATGINYNNVWAALGYPIDVIAIRQKKGEPEDFHAGGSDASGIVWAVGSEVNDVKVGEEVVIHSGTWAPNDPWVVAGKDPMLAPSVKVWGYETNYGSYCQFAKAQSHQILKKPISISEIISSYSGIRPLIKSNDNFHKSSRDFFIQKDNSLLTIFGGKWTTSPSIARKIVTMIENAEVS